MLLRHDKFSRVKIGIMIFAFLFLALANFAVFYVYINFDTIKSTFYVYINGEYEWAGLFNYKQIVQNIFVKETTLEHFGFQHSFHALAINFIILPISIIVAYAFYKKVPGTTFYRIIFYIPSIISIVVLSTAFREMFGTRTHAGPIAELLHLFGIDSPVATGNIYYNWMDFSDETAATQFWPLVYLFCIFNGLGTNVILIASAMQRIPTEVSEAAKLDGCGFFRELWSISLPLVLSTIAMWVILIFGAIFSFSFAPMFISGDVNGAGNNLTTTTAWQMFINAQAGSSPEQLITVATTGIFLSLFVLPMSLLCRALLRKFTTEVSY